MALTQLGASHGFTAGDLDTSGQVAVCAAYQKLYFASGSPWNADISLSGYHKLDFLNTRLVGVASGAFTKGEVMTQATSGASGIFDETVTVGAETWHLVYRTTTTEFNTTNVITGDTSTETLTPTSVVAPPHWLNWTLTVGTFPDAGSDVLALMFGRVFMNSRANVHQWFATRINDPLDLALVTDDIASATNGQSAEKLGLVGDPLVAMVAHKDIFGIFGCVNKMFIMRGDPNRNGFFASFSDNTGIFSNTSYCFDDKYNFYWVGNDGIYTISYDGLLNGGTANNITKQNVPTLIKSLGLNRGTDRISMVFDKDRYGIHITVSEKDGAWHVALWLDLRTEGVFPESYASGIIPSSAFYYDSKLSAERTCLAGCYDGYIRKWSETDKSDMDAVDADAAINSYCLVGPIAGDAIRGKIKLDEISVRTGIDTDRLTLSLYAAETSAQLIADLKNGVTPRVSKEFTIDALLQSLRPKIIAGSFGLLLSNNVADSSFSLEKIDAELSESGRIK
jgi:hypothetical protein